MHKKSISFGVIVIIVFLINVSIINAAQDLGGGGTAKSSDELDTALDNLASGDLGSGDISTIQDNWNDPRVQAQKADLYQNNLKDFQDKFAAEQAQNGINIGNLGSDASYSDGTLTAGGQTVDLNQFEGSDYNFNVIDGQLQITDDGGNLIDMSKEGQSANVGKETADDGSNILTADKASFDYTYPNTNTKASLVTATNIKISDNYLSADNARMFTQTKQDNGIPTVISASNVKNLVVVGNNLSFDHADSVVSSNNWLATDVFNFKGNIETFKLKEADIVIANGNQIINPENTTFAIYQQNTIIIPKKNATIQDTRGTDTEFISYLDAA